MTVYSPAEDSLLLKNYLKELDLEGRKVLDMGTGSGIIGIECAKESAEVVCADNNPEALDEARNRAGEDLLHRIEFVETDLFENIDEKFDIVLFNPPYLPGEEGAGDEEIWLGGEKGTEVTRRFLEQLPEYLEEGGEAYMVVSSRAEWKKLKDDFDLELVDSKNLWFETLYIARFR